MQLKSPFVTARWIPVSHPDITLTVQISLYGHTVWKIIKKQLFCIHGWEQEIIANKMSQIGVFCFACCNNLSLGVHFEPSPWNCVLNRRCSKAHIKSKVSLSYIWNGGKTPKCNWAVRSVRCCAEANSKLVLSSSEGFYATSSAIQKNWPFFCQVFYFMYLF